MSNKTKAHIQYRLKNGTRVVGTTTVTGQIAKPQLIPWSNKLGLQGIDYKKYLQERADIGTLGHEMIHAYLNLYKGDLDLGDDYTANQRTEALNSFNSFLKYANKNRLEPILLEHPLVSEVFKYGGTLDFYGKENGVPTLLDFKTGKGIYWDHFAQLGAYEKLLIEHGYKVEQKKILRVGTENASDFDVYEKESLEDYWQLFLILLEFYRKKKEYKIR